MAEASRLLADVTSKGFEHLLVWQAGITGIRAEALRQIGNTRFSVQVWIELKDFSRATQDLLLSGAVQGDEVEEFQTLFAKWFKGESTLSISSRSSNGVRGTCGCSYKP